MNNKLSLSIILISYCMTSCYTIDKHIHKSDNITSSYNLFIEQSATILKKNAALIACIPLCMYYHNNIINLFAHHPFITGCGLYFLIHYSCDCMLQYNEQKTLFDCIYIIKKIALNLVICHGIHNYAHQKKLALPFVINNEIFINNSKENVVYSFDQIESMTLQFYIKLKKRLNNLQHLIHIESEEFVYLSHASCIDMQSMLDLTENDPDLHAMICKFEKNPQEELEHILQFLKKQLYHNFTDMQHHLTI